MQVRNDREDREENSPEKPKAEEKKNLSRNILSIGQELMKMSVQPSPTYNMVIQVETLRVRKKKSYISPASCVLSKRDKQVCRISGSDAFL